MIFILSFTPLSRILYLYPLDKSSRHKFQQQLLLQLQLLQALAAVAAETNTAAYELDLTGKVGISGL